MTNTNADAGKTADQTAHSTGPGEGVPVVRAAVDADLDAVTDVMAAAFLDSPEGPWLIPDRTQRHAVYVRYCGALAAYVMGDRAGLVEVAQVDGRAVGVAVWFDYVHYPQTDPMARQELAALTAEVCGPHADRFGLLDDTYAAHHPNAAHWYLAWLGVDPFRQGRGIGTALLRHRHTDLDHIGAPSYLVATTWPARQLYRRHGYEDRPVSPFFLPENGPPMFPMWRGPAPTKPSLRVAHGDPGE
ncbi:GNAT family N-acetyltransferase [Micromonospora sp. CPCC 205371]|nr:GNAT family N-acetyltransferase [Micromonospora sp. CPCC 205371]